jgi:predicted DCC family thiol-disulfide oxidoreductase YuxK
MLRRFLLKPTEAPAKELFFEGRIDVDYVHPVWCRLLHMAGLIPPKGKNIPLTLFVSKGNIWFRSYGGHHITTSWNSVGEQFYGFRLQFDVADGGSTIIYNHKATTFMDIIKLPNFLLKAAVIITPNTDTSWDVEIQTRIFDHLILRQRGHVEISTSRYHRPLHHLILFDGHCVLCNNTVDFIIKRDSRKPNGLPLFKMAAIQSPAGQKVIHDENVDSSTANNLSSVILITSDGRVFTESDAGLRIAKGLVFPWPFIGTLGLLVPKYIRDVVYRLVGRNRYKLFGVKESCSMPSEDNKVFYL